MSVTEKKSTSRCPECGGFLSVGICPSCAFGILLKPSQASGEVDRHDDRYVLKEGLAAGGMGVVYVAEDRLLRRKVALKMIRGSIFANEAEISRFRIEAEAAAALDHPNIVPIYEIGLRDEQPFYTMKLIDGESLTARLRAPAEARPALRETVSWLVQITRAVHHAHQRGVLHRDLKPGNILIDSRDRPWLADFGLAKLSGEAAKGDLTMTADHFGTPNYMSPEVVNGSARDYSVASDIWALGVILWEVIFGSPPFKGSSPMEIMRRISDGEPSRPRGAVADRDLMTLAQRCMEKDPARRPQSADELAAEMERWLRGEPLQARPVSAAEWLWKWMRRKPVWAALAAALVLGGATSLLQWRRAESAVTTLTETNDSLGRALSIATATKLAGDARMQVAENPSRALLLAVGAAEQTEKVGMGVLPEVAEALHETLQQVGGWDISARVEVESDVRDGYIYRGMSDILPVLFSPDGNAVLTTDWSDDQQKGVEVGLFDVRGKVLARWKLWERLGLANQTAWLPGSRKLVDVGPDGTVTLWHTDRVVDGVPDRVVLGDFGHSYFRIRLLADPDSGGLNGVAAFRDGDVWCHARIRIRPDAETPLWIGERMPMPPGVERDSDVIFSPKGEWLVVTEGTSSRKRLMRTGEAESAVVIDQGDRQILFDDRDRWLGLSGFSGPATVLRLGGNSPEEAAGSAFVLPGCESDTRGLVFSTGDQRVAVGIGETRVRIVDLGSPSLAGQTVSVSQGRVIWMRFNPTGDQIAVAGTKRLVSVWQTDKPDVAPQEYRGLPAPVIDVRFSPDGRFMVANGLNCSSRCWYLEGGVVGAQPMPFRSCGRSVTDLAVSPDRDWIASACGSSIRLTESATDQTHVVCVTGAPTTGVAFSQDGIWLAGTGQDGFARVWRVDGLLDAIRAGQPLPMPEHVLDMTDTRLEYARKVAFHPRGVLYCTCGDGVLFEWDLRLDDPDATRVEHLLHSIRYVLPDVTVSPDGRWLAVARHGWDAEPKPGSTQTGNLVLLYDVSQPGEPVPVAELGGGFLGSTNIDFSGDGRWLAAGAAGNKATVWDLTASDIDASRRESHVAAHCMAGVAFAPDSSVLALGGSDGRIHLWDWRRSEGRERTIQAGGEITTLAWLDDTRLVSGGVRTAFGVWETDIQALKELARQVAGRSLSDEEWHRFRMGR